jgi:hypothetical protein
VLFGSRSRYASVCSVYGNLLSARVHVIQPRFGVKDHE